MLSCTAARGLDLSVSNDGVWLATAQKDGRLREHRHNDVNATEEFPDP
jgi:hypothetical protein